MLYLLHGKDTYRRDVRLNEIRTSYHEKNPDSLGETVVDGEDEDALQKLYKAISQGGGLFGAKTLVVARGCFSTNKSGLLKLIKERRIEEDTAIHMVLVEGNVGKSKDANAVVELAQAEEFSALDLTERTKWIARYVKTHGGSGAPSVIGKKAAERLAELGDDLRLIANEIEKLLAYAYGEDAITEAHVERLVQKPIEETIFSLSDGACDRNPVKALAALARLTVDGEDMSGLISYTIKEMRQLVRAGFALQAEIPGDPEELFGAKPFVWRKRTGQAGKWDKEELRELSVRIAKLDFEWKGSVDKRLALEKLILENVPSAK